MVVEKIGIMSWILIGNIKSECSCIDCGCSDIRVLEFDHVRGKKHNSVSRLLATAASWEKISIEIAKCEVRCANCHRLKTIERGGWWRSKAGEQ